MGASKGFPPSPDVCKLGAWGLEFGWDLGVRSLSSMSQDGSWLSGLIFHHIYFVTSQFSTHHLTPPEGSCHRPHLPVRNRQLLPHWQVKKLRLGKLNDLLRGSHTSSGTPGGGHLATQHLGYKCWAARRANRPHS